MLPALVVSAIVCLAASIALLLGTTVAPPVVEHLSFAVGIMPLIFGAMLYFVPVLTRSRVTEPAVWWLPVLAGIAALLVVSGFAVPAFFTVGSNAGAALALMTVLVLAAWMVKRGQAALDPPHPCLYWYLAAVLCLALALVAVLAMPVWPSQRLALRLLHLHLNTLGFIGITAIGTLQVLLPTAAGRPDQNAGERLRSDLPLTVIGVLCVAVGAAWLMPLAYAGTVLLLFVVLRLATVWVTRFRDVVFRLNGAAPSLALALFGLFAMLIFGMVHAQRWLDGRNTVYGFILAFLLPLVTGAASQLLPLWIRPGMQTAWHTRARDTLTRFAGIRALAFVAAGLGCAAGWHAAAWLGALALVWFAGQMLRAFTMRA